MSNSSFYLYRNTTSGKAVIVVLLLLLLAGGFYFYQANDEKMHDEVNAVKEETFSSGGKMEEKASSVRKEKREKLNETVVRAPKNQTVNNNAVRVVKDLELVEESVDVNQNMSDQYITQRDLYSVLPKKFIEQFLYEGNYLDRIVVFVNEIESKNLSRKNSVFKPFASQLEVIDIDGKLYIHPNDKEKFNFLINILPHLNINHIVDFYVEYEKVLQKKQDELYVGRFNDKLVNAIDLLLATPLVKEPIEVKSESVNYTFVDLKLEALPESQKMMIRMGEENSTKLKLFLKELKKQFQMK